MCCCLQGAHQHASFFQEVEHSINQAILSCVGDKHLMQGAEGQHEAVANCSCTCGGATRWLPHIEWPSCLLQLNLQLSGRDAMEVSACCHQVKTCLKPVIPPASTSRNRSTRRTHRKLQQMCGKTDFVGLALHRIHAWKRPGTSTNVFHSGNAGITHP